MKILHTADWHLGKIVNEYSMLDNQKHMLEELIELIKEEKPDVIIVSGDVYDRSIPPKEAVELLDTFLGKVVYQLKIPLLMISGNHDSHERLEFGKRLLEMGQLYIEGKTQSEIRKVTLNDQYGPVNFYLLPYIHPTMARITYDEPSIVDHQSLMEYFMNNLTLAKDERNVFINHNFFITNLEQAITSDSERNLSIGGAEVIDVELVKAFDYVALGHLHRPQKIKYDHVRYSGSLLKYSGSEIKTTKGVYIIDLKEKGDIDIHFRKLTPKQDFVEIIGTLDELLQKDFYKTQNKQDYFFVVLEDTTDLYDPLAQLRAIYPNIMQIERPNFMRLEEQKERRRAIKNKNTADLFDDFYLEMIGEEITDVYKEEVKIVMDELMKRGDDE